MSKNFSIPPAKVYEKIEQGRNELCSLCGRPIGDKRSLINAGKIAHEKCALERSANQLKKAGLRK